ncbi:MAG: DUF2721 domain-containing protein [Vicinamibacterales bacterium]
MEMSLHQLLPILQFSIGPVILISGVGLLILSMTNRFGRVIDRSRLLAVELRTAEGPAREAALAQLRVLSHRARLTRLAIFLAVLSVLFAAVLVITLFMQALVGWDTGVPVVVFFICCMGTLIGALIAFLQDINLSLTALQVETGMDR